jgi:hypothetical protein
MQQSRLLSPEKKILTGVLPARQCRQCKTRTGRTSFLQLVSRRVIGQDLEFELERNPISCRCHCQAPPFLGKQVLVNSINRMTFQMTPFAVELPRGTLLSHSPLTPTGTLPFLRSRRICFVGSVPGEVKACRGSGSYLA